MIWHRWIQKFKGQPALPPWQRVEGAIELESAHLSPKIFENWVAITETELHLSEEEMTTAVESCLWALYFLKLVEEVEFEARDPSLVAQELESVQSARDENDGGCRIRYARGMLQEYAESGRSYQSQDKNLYFGEWLYNCNQKKDGGLAFDPARHGRLGQILTEKDGTRSWFKG